MCAFDTMGLHRGVRAVVVVAIVSISGFAADKLLRATTDGEVATFAASDGLPGIVTLPEVVVTAPRIESHVASDGAE